MSIAYARRPSAFITALAGIHAGQERIANSIHRGEELEQRVTALEKRNQGPDPLPPPANAARRVLLARALRLLNTAEELVVDKDFDGPAHGALDSANKKLKEVGERGATGGVLDEVTRELDKGDWIAERIRAAFMRLADDASARDSRLAFLHELRRDLHLACSS